MSDSILTTTKKALGITEEYTHFDPDLIMYINSAFSVMTQLGVGPLNGFTITGSDEKWSDYAISDIELGFAKSYVPMKVKMMFDPPTTAALIDANNKMISEYEWRLNVEAESKEGGTARV